MTSDDRLMRQMSWLLQTYGWFGMSYLSDGAFHWLAENTEMEEMEMWAVTGSLMCRVHVGKNLFTSGKNGKSCLYKKPRGPNLRFLFS